MTQKVLFMKGLPGSGKSTYAKELVTKGWKRVNKDDLRAMMDNSNWSKENEKQVNDIQDRLILDLVAKGHNVVVDNTHILGNHIERITGLIRASGYTDVDVSTHFMATPVSTCIARDLARPNSVGKKVIRRMYESAKELYVQKYKSNPDLPTGIIVDIDGTLAHMNGRSPYDYTKVTTDTVDETVKEIVNRYRNTDPLSGDQCYVIIVSGRDDTCKEETINWLNDNGIYFDELHMRDPELVDEEGKKLDDTVIKRDIFEKWIRNRYNIKFVLDDRNRVVEMWRGLGLKVLQVEEGDF